jgi:hypothetical protein
LQNIFVQELRKTRCDRFEGMETSFRQEFELINMTFELAEAITASQQTLPDLGWKKIAVELPITSLAEKVKLRKYMS